MSASQESEKPAGTKKKFQKGEREVPHHTQKAKKFYPAEDESKPKKVRLEWSLACSTFLTVAERHCFLRHGIGMMHLISLNRVHQMRMPTI